MLQRPHAHDSGMMVGASSLEKMEMDAALSDESAIDAAREADEVGEVLQKEVARCTIQRRREWRESVKVLASSFKEACSERVGIWEHAAMVFARDFPQESNGVGRLQGGQVGPTVASDYPNGGVAYNATARVVDTAMAGGQSLDYSVSTMASREGGGISNGNDGGVSPLGGIPGSGPW